MAVNLTAKEVQILGAFIGQLDGVPQVDWNVIASQVNIAHGKNARRAFNQAWDKLKAGGTILATPSNAGVKNANGDENDDEPVTPKVKTPKKGNTRKVGGSSNPRKAGATKTPEKGKKGKEEPKSEDVAPGFMMKHEDSENQGSTIIGYKTPPTPGREYLTPTESSFNGFEF